MKFHFKELVDRCFNVSRVTTIPHLNRLRVIKIPQLETG
jgi:hypothetical protein